MIEYPKQDPAGVANPEPGSVVSFVDLTGRPVAKDEQGTLFDFTGPSGSRGWGPVFGVVNDGERRVLRLTGYAGGEGIEPTANIGMYVGPMGLVATITDATDIRGTAGIQGLRGLTGEQGMQGIQGIEGPPGSTVAVQAAGNTVIAAPTALNFIGASVVTRGTVADITITTPVTSVAGRTGAVVISSTDLADFAEAAQDAAAAALQAGTSDGVTVTYSDAGNSLVLTNTDKGTTAVAAHTALSDPHTQYLTVTRGDARYSMAGHTHTSAAITDFAEAAQDATGAAIAAGTNDGITATYNDAGNSLSFVNTDKGSAAVTAHVAATDPHTQYLTVTRGDARYPPLVHTHTSGSITDFAEAAQDATASALAAGTQTGVSVAYDDTANSLSITNTDRGSSAVATHVAAANPHPQYMTTSGAAAAAPVQSVAGRTGNVVITSTDLADFATRVETVTSQAFAAGTQQGVGFSYDSTAHSFTLTNLDRGSTAVSTHAAEDNPHPQYTTPVEAAAAAPVQSVNGNTGTVSVPTTGRLLRITRFTASGTWTKQADTSAILVRICGGGGAGGGTSAAAGYGPGGGGGGTAEDYIAAPLASYAVTIGAGGTGTAAAGGNGGNSTFGAVLTGGGGTGGLAGAASSGRSGVLGGTATGGSVQRRGGPGGPSAATAAIGTGFGGGGGGSFYGGGTNGLGGLAAPGQAGSAGRVNSGEGGGGGAGANGVGGAGGSGYCEVYEYA